MDLFHFMLYYFLVLHEHCQLYFVSSDRYSELYIRIQRYETSMSLHLEVPILFLNVGLKLPSSQFVSISDKSASGLVSFTEKNISVSFKNTSCSEFSCIDIFSKDKNIIISSNYFFCFKMKLNSVLLYLFVDIFSFLEVNK